MTDAFPFIPASSPIGDRDQAVLRSLGRFEFMLFSWIQALHYPDVDRSIAYRHLDRLEAEGYLWRKTGPRSVARTTKANGTKPIRTPSVYGLTHEGKQYLMTTEAEPDMQNFDRLHSRDRKNLQVPETTMAHDLQAAWWCSQFVNEVRRSPRLKDVYVQVEYSTEGQRLDALVIARWWRQLPKQHDPLPAFAVPWWDNTPVAATATHQIAVALEIDRGTEALKILLAKGVTYRDLTANKYYQQRIGVDVRPVFVVPTAKRAQQIAREWQDAWPTNPGVITTARSAAHPQFGTLWGDYRAMANGQHAPLLAPIGCSSPEMWEREWRGTVDHRGAK